MTEKVVSTWSLHRALGRFKAGDVRSTRGRSASRAAERFVARISPAPADDGAMDLLELPSRLSQHGYDAVQIVHFHLSSRDPSYLAELRSELDRNGMRLDTFLVDDGDLTHPTDAAADEDWISEWLEDAEVLGALRARVIAGRSAPTQETIAHSAAGLRRLAQAHPGLRVVFENWLEMTPGSSAVNAIVDAAGDSVGLLVDLANWTGPSTCDELAAIAGRAETCHAKCRVGDTGFAAESSAVREYVDALSTIRDVGFTGSLALVYDGADPDEWRMLDDEFALVQQVFN